MQRCCYVMYPEQIIKRYGELDGEIHAIELQRGSSAASLGLDLSGNISLETMSVFVVNIHPDSIAARDGRINIGDQLLEVQQYLALRNFLCDLRYANHVIINNTKVTI